MFEIGKEEAAAAERVILSGKLFRHRGSEGGEVDAFEAEMRELFGCRHFLSTTSGTASLICALAALDIGPGDEVIVPGYTFIATGLAVLHVGAIPVLADVDASLTLDPADVERRITAHTRAIVPVHMLGRPCDMDAIMAVADRYGLVVCEDACQAVGGSYHGKRLGTIGQAGALSFNYFKNITCGEGGGVLTNNRRLFERARVYHDGGGAFFSQKDEVYNEPLFAGSNYRLNEILGAILRVQAGRLDGILDRLRARKRSILDILADCPAIEITPSNDPAGDCGSNFAFLCASREARLELDAKLRARDPAYAIGSPIDSGRHVYSNWECFLERRGGHHPAMNPWRMAENRDLGQKVHKNLLPQTLNVLDRTAYIGLQTVVDEDWYRAWAEAIRAILG